MNVEQRVRLWSYAKFLGMFLVGIVFAVVAQAVAQTNNPQKDGTQEEESFTDCMTSASSLLSARQQALKRREADVKDKEKNIEDAAKRLKQQFEDLTEIREELRQKMKEMDATKLEKIKGLVARFQKVRAKQAAAILEKTDDEVSVMVLEQMNAANSGKILAAMKAEKAAYLTEMLAQHTHKKGEKPKEAE